MSVRPFLIWPDAKLRTPCAPVALVDEAVRAIWADMVDTMEAMPGQGVGLAACQIGVMLRLAVVDASTARGEVVRMANPVLLRRSDETRTHEEASPNLPGVSARVTRPATVEIQYLDETGAEHRRSFDGLWATSVQHQLDHLDGHVFADRLSRTKRQMLLKRFEKLRKA